MGNPGTKVTGMRLPTIKPKEHPGILYVFTVHPKPTALTLRFVSYKQHRANGDFLDKQPFYARWQGGDSLARHSFLKSALQSDQQLECLQFSVQVGESSC